MKKRPLKLRITAGIVAALTLFLCIAVTPGEVNAASSKANKAFRLKVSFNGKESTTDEIWDQNTYSVHTQLKKTGKIKKGTTVSWKAFVPKKLLKKDGDTILFCMDLNLLTYDKKTKEYKYEGSVFKTRWLSISKEGKKVRLGIYNELADKEEGSVRSNGKKVKKIGSRATIKEQGNYYVLTMKDTLRNKFFDGKTRKETSLNTKKSYTLLPEFVVHGDCSKLSGYVYLDEFTLKAAKKETITFNNKKEYAEAYAIHFGGKDWGKNGKVVELLY